MSDYISKKTAMQIVLNEQNRRDMLDKFKSIPCADVRENIHGEWIHYNDEFYSPDRLTPVLRHIVECSVCHHKIADFHGLMYFCTNCGADMRGKAE